MRARAVLVCGGSGSFAVLPSLGNDSFGLVDAGDRGPCDALYLDATVSIVLELKLWGRRIEKVDDRFVVYFNEANRDGVVSIGTCVRGNIKDISKCACR